METLVTSRTEKSERNQLAKPMCGVSFRTQVNGTSIPYNEDLIPTQTRSDGVLFQKPTFRAHFQGMP
jgi:hypothetical protein